MVPAINVFGNRTHELEDKQNLVYIKDNLNNICSAPQKSADFSGTPPRPTLALAKEDISPLSQQQSVSSPLSNVLISLRSNDRVAYGEAEELSMLSLEKMNFVFNSSTLCSLSSMPREGVSG